MDKISDLKQIIISTLDTNKAQDIISIDLKENTYPYAKLLDSYLLKGNIEKKHIISEKNIEKLKLYKQPFNTNLFAQKAAEIALNDHSFVNESKKIMI